MVDADAYAYRKHPAYTAIAHQTQGRAMTTATEYARNDAAGRRLVRVERKIGDDTTVYLSNSRGNWIVKGRRAARVTAVPELWRTFPLRFPTARLAETIEPVFAREPGAEYFAMRVVRVGVGFALDPTAPLHGGADPPSAKPDQTQPRRYEYLIDEKTRTLVGWRALAADGATLKETGYQEFIVGDVPESLFELPPDVTIIAPESAEEMRRFIGAN